MNLNQFGQYLVCYRREVTVRMIIRYFQVFGNFFGQRVAFLVPKVLRYYPVEV